MKKTILNLIALTMVVSAFANGEHHDWEDHHVLQINREPARAYFIPYGEKQGDRILSLNGDWQFRWTKTPEGRIKDFWHTDFDASGWKTLAVPANWEVNGYGTPIYVSAGYPFKIDPPYVTRDLRGAQPYGAVSPYVHGARWLARGSDLPALRGRNVCILRLGERTTGRLQPGLDGTIGIQRHTLYQDG